MARTGCTAAKSASPPRAHHARAAKVRQYTPVALGANTRVGLHEPGHCRARQRLVCPAPCSVSIGVGVGVGVVPASNSIPWTLTAGAAAVAVRFIGPPFVAQLCFAHAVTHVPHRAARLEPQPHTRQPGIRTA
jgi:hypothetical protein